MRALRVCALAALLVAYASAAPGLVDKFEAFKAKYGRRYASAEEEARRFRIFSENMRTAAELQAMNPHANFGVNEFADVSKDEFKVYHNAENVYKSAKRVKLQTMHFSDRERANTVSTQDWRPKGAVTPVKNQGQCGSCWSFSTTGGIEGQWFLAGNTLTSVSEQELVSCDTIDQGCNGGLMDNAFTWLLQTHNGTIVTEASYPYVSGNGNVPACSMTGTQFGAQIQSYNNVQQADMTTFVSTNGPLSLAVYAEPWQTYTGGILTNCPNQQIDHGVLIVGYDDTNSPPYWIIKNSWGPSWGEEGYIRVAKNNQQCSIGSYQTSAIVQKSGPTPAPGPNPPGPTAPPSPSNGNYVQKTCSDDKCSQCTEQSFATGTCVQRGSGSFRATCATDAVIIEAFSSADCSGSATTTSDPLDTCSIVFTTSGQEFVQNECRSGPNPPGPTPPTPPSPPAPTPTPASSTFTQKQCTDSACTQGCQSQTFPQNTCLQLSGGGSATAVCQPTQLLMTAYPLSNDCTGPSEQSPQPVNQCTADEAGTYFENVCGGSSTGALQTGLKML